MPVNDETLIAALPCLSDWVRWGASRFKQAGLVYGHGTDNAIDEALTLVLHALHLEHDLPQPYWHARLDPEERVQVLGLLRRRYQERVPVPYLTGRAWFCGLEFEVDERVLIPRSPIAELIESGFEPWLEPAGVGRILDLCTGSGCIAIACAEAFPAAQVDACDLSGDALTVAEANRARFGLEQRLNLYQADLFEGLPAARYDLIVSNPPYVDAGDMAGLPAEFRHEPAFALASGEDGLDATRRILAQAGDWLSDHGVLVVEVGNSQRHVEATYPGLPLVWLEFERGGEGVFLITAADLLANRQQLAAAAAGVSAA